MVFEFELSLLIWLICWFGPMAVAAWTVYYLASLPLRRAERARFFLDLLELGLKEGRAPEQTIVEVSRSRDSSMGARFHLLAAHLETGLRLGGGLEKVPRLLPPQLRAMLKAGEEIGDVRKVLPACRRLLKDGLSQTRGAMNYLILIVLALSPFAPAILRVLSIFVFPKFLAILREMEVEPPAFTLYVVNQSGWLATAMTVAALAIYLTGLVYVGGPRLSGWLQSGLVPVADWLACLLPWRRKRMQRDFAALLGILLDANVPEERAVSLAAAGTANAVFRQRAERVAIELRAGRALPEALRSFDDKGELRWRLANASRSQQGFRAALNGWLEALDAKAFQQEQSAAHAITTAVVIGNGVLVGVLVVGIFQTLIAIIDAGILW
jgi:type II secretory pathway component PulF